MPGKISETVECGRRGAVEFVTGGKQTVSEKNEKDHISSSSGIGGRRSDVAGRDLFQYQRREQPTLLQQRLDAAGVQLLGLGAAGVPLLV